VTEQKNSRGVWLEVVVGIASNVTFASSWQVGVMVLGSLVIVGVLRLLTERQRRKTIVEVLSRAPAGATVFHQAFGRSVVVRMGPTVPPQQPFPVRRDSA